MNIKIDSREHNNDMFDAIQNATGHDMTDMIVVKKEIVDDKVKVVYKLKRD